MKVILQKDLKDVGKIGDLVNVSMGFARNYLLPRKLAVQATEKRMNEWEHLQKVAQIQKKKADAQRMNLVEKLEGVTVQFKVKAAESEKIFGSITNSDISDRLEEMGYSIDKRDICLEEPIKILGQHLAIVKFGDGQQAEIKVFVERESGT